MKNRTISTNVISSFLVDGKYRVYRHLALQAVILMISIGVFFDAPDKLNLSVNRFYGWVSYHLFMNMLVYFNSFVLFPRFLAKNKLVAYAISVILFTIFALVVMVILQELFYDIAVTRQQPSGVAIFFSITSSMLSVLLFLGGISALLLFKQWIINNRRIDDLRQATSQSQLSFLKSQINPHFLFNMINNASILVDYEPTTASGVLATLDNMLHYQFNIGMQNRTSLKADVTFLNDFLSLEKMRRDEFEYILTIERTMGDIEVPPLLFIPFVENAVKHSADTKSSYVHVTFTMENSCLFFKCDNSKPLKPVEFEAGGLGLVNIRRRLDLLFANDYELDIVETEVTYSVNLELNLL